MPNSSYRWLLRSVGPACPRRRRRSRLLLTSAPTPVGTQSPTHPEKERGAIHHAWSLTEADCGSPGLFPSRTIIPRLMSQVTHYGLDLDDGAIHPPGPAGAPCPSRSGWRPRSVPQARWQGPVRGGVGGFHQGVGRHGEGAWDARRLEPVGTGNNGGPSVDVGGQNQNQDQDRGHSQGRGRGRVQAQAQGRAASRTCSSALHSGRVRPSGGRNLHRGRRRPFGHAGAQTEPERPRTPSRPDPVPEPSRATDAPSSALGSPVPLG